MPVGPIPPGTEKEIVDPVYEDIGAAVKQSDNVKMEQNPAYGTSTL